MVVSLTSLSNAPPLHSPSSKQDQSSSLAGRTVSVLTQVDGTEISGQIVNGTGFGTKVYPPGHACIIYQGKLKNGEPDGKGCMAYEGDKKIDGHWERGRAKGYCVVTKGLETYAGNIENGYAHGQGTKTYADGSKYVGFWVRGIREGEGVFYHVNSIASKGFWKGGILWKGFGLLAVVGGGRYEGEIEDGVPHGKGTIIRLDGSKYESVFQKRTAMHRVLPAEETESPSTNSESCASTKGTNSSESDSST